MWKLDALGLDLDVRCHLAHPAAQQRGDQHTPTSWRTSRAACCAAPAHLRRVCLISRNPNSISQLVVELGQLLRRMRAGTQQGCDEAAQPSTHAHLDQACPPVAGQMRVCLRLWGTPACGSAHRRRQLLTISWRRLSRARINQWRCVPAARQSNRTRPRSTPGQTGSLE